MDKLFPNSDWSKAQWAAALKRVPALVLVLGLAVACHQLAVGVVSAGASLSVGLVGTRQIAGSSWWAMVATCLVMGISAGVGTLVGASFWLVLVVTMVWCVVFAFLTVHDEDSGWILMQGVIVLVIAMSFPSHGFAAMERSLAVLTGGALQMGILLIFYAMGRLARMAENEKMEPKTSVKALKWSDYLHSFRLASAAVHYAIRVALTMLIAIEFAHWLAIQNGYWLPMTTIIILKPDFYRTYSGAVQRVAGTFLGVVVASLIAHLFHPVPGLLLILVALFSFGCFALLKVNSVLFSASLTAYVIFLISITGLPETMVTGHRLILTALGSALALGSRMVGYHHIIKLWNNQPASPSPQKGVPVTS